MKPINMKTWEVQAVLADRKTVTRRVVKHNPCECESKQLNGVCKICDDKGGFFWPDEYVKARSPYQPGDILYVRETWQEVYETEFDEDAQCGFVNIRERILNFDEIPKVEAGISSNCSTATMEPRMKYYVFKASDIEYADSKNGLYWHPFIHMPREAARIFLRVTDVWVERLQDMQPYDIAFEGFRRQQDFKAFWDSTLKPKDRAIYGWEANPWVWVVAFEKISREEAEICPKGK